MTLFLKDAKCRMDGDLVRIEFPEPETPINIENCEQLLREHSILDDTLREQFSGAIANLIRDAGIYQQIKRHLPR